jgi:Cu/Ag efflux protein CusF
MIKNTCLLLVALLSLHASVSWAAVQKESDPPAAAATAPAKARAFPFRGKIAAVDQEAKNITLRGKDKNRVFQVTEKTKIVKDGKPSSLSEARVGDEVGGQAQVAGEGKYEALSLRLGAKPDANAKAASSSAQSSNELMK